MNETYHGIVRSGELATPLTQVTLYHYNGDGKLKHNTKTDSEGRWQLDNVSPHDQITFDKTGYNNKRYHGADLPKLVRLIQTQLIGYQEKLWYQPGDTIEVFVHSDEDYEVQLYRHGWTKKLIKDVGRYSQQKQQLPDTFFVEEGLDWEASFTYSISADAQSGLYSLLLSSDTLESFAIPFIISPHNSRTSNPKLLVLASTNNWQSYNIWGGRSRYRNYEGEYSPDYISEPGLLAEWAQQIGQIIPSSWRSRLRSLLGWKKTEPAWKFKRLAIQRPFSNCALEEETPHQPFTNHLAAGEWRVLAWLEREGYSYDVISGYELHHNPDILDRYKGLICSTHCEYWSAEMYHAVKRYHNQEGLSLFNISGNTMYRSVEFFEDGSHRCTNLRFKNEVEDETQLLGVRFSLADYSTCSAYEITKPEHWIFDNLPIHKKQREFGRQSLNQNTPKKSSRYDPGRPGTEFGLLGTGASGWETDKLSKNAPSDFTVVAKGKNRWGGADMVVREPSGRRGGLFSASSITFGGSLLIDEACSRIVKNAFNRFLS